MSLQDLALVATDDPVLRRVAALVDLRYGAYIVSMLWEAFGFQEDAIGLAAPQIGESSAVAVIEVAGHEVELVNPRITSHSRAKLWEPERCLSLPGVEVLVPRWRRVTVAAADGLGRAWSASFDGLLGACVQHEIDHLNGKLITDYLEDK